MSKKQKKQTTKITVEAYIKAIKKADRDIDLANQPGWKRTTNVHKSKKAYDRKRSKNFLKGE